jgi:RNA polymerase sigma-70 factor (ECF subfamily)
MAPNSWDQMPADPARPLRLVAADSAARQPTAAEVDADLLTAVRAGQNAAAVAFHDRVRPIVERTLGRLLGARDPDHEDLTQQALIDLVLSLERFRGECPLDAWAAVISARAAYKHIRRRKIERRLFVLSDSEGLERVDRAASNTALYRNSIRRVEKHLAGMDAKRAWTFVLHDVHGFSLKEISEITKVSVAAVQSRLVRGRKEMHQRIVEDPDLVGSMDDFARSHRELHD